MEKLDQESIKVAKANLQSDLEESIGQSPQGLSEADLDECWKLAKAYWNTQ